MATKKYGISGVMEYKAVLFAGSVPVNIHFSGGALSGYGVSPAEFATDSEFLQHVIEQSPEFKSGKIKLTGIIGSRPNKEETASVEEKAVSENQLEKVEVPSIADAKQYLVDNFGERPSDLRSRAAIDKCAAAHGVVFEIH